MIELVFYATVLGITLSFMVGPVFFVLLETSITKGARQAIQFDLGVLLADVIFITVAYFGSEALLEGIQQSNELYWLGGFIIFIFGLFGVIRAQYKKKLNPVTFEFQVKPASWYWMKGFLLNFLNVGVLFYWITSMIILKNRYSEQPTYVFIYFAITLIAYFITDLLKIFFARKLKNLLTTKSLLNLEKMVGFIMMAFGIGVALRGIQ